MADNKTITAPARTTPEEFADELEKVETSFRISKLLQTAERKWEKNREFRQIDYLG
jgi:hypothetical protein